MENDRAFVELLNDCLDAVERREASIEDCLARYPQHAARLEGLLRLGDEARQVPIPVLTPERLAAGEERLLQALRTRAAETPPVRGEKRRWTTFSERLFEPAKERIRAWPRWAVPAMAAAGSLAVLLACVLVVTLGAGATWWTLRDKGALSDRPEVLATRTLETSVAQNPRQTPERQVAPQSTQTPEPDAAHVAYLPFLSDPLSPDSAILLDVRGVVEFQAVGQAWALADGGQIVQAGQRVRTGALSGAQIAFYDGSVATLGPDSELSIDGLGQDPTDESRIVELTQWAGESKHDVKPASGSHARYAVHTSSGTGEARGTSFHVRVVPALRSWFSVDEGAVAVTHLQVTVVVVAGQLLTVPVDRAPGEPFFRVTGEGEVTQIGETWEIAGQAFSTHDLTLLVGNPQIGDWVYVDGHLLPDGTRVADRIVLLRRSPENRFTIVGEVEAQQAAMWTVAGQDVAVSAATELDDGIQIGDRVRAQGVIDENGALLAESIQLIETLGVPFSFVGVLEANLGETWRISGVPITVDAETILDEALAAGDLVRVRGVFLDTGEGVWLARSIRRLAPRERRFEFVGRVETIDPWVVSGVAIETRMWTEIGAEIAVGDRVKVEGQILADGTWLADEIKLADEQPGLSFEFVGTVESIKPWIVSGISLVVDDRTEIKDEIEVGDRVKVEGRILPDGRWLATEIKLSETGFGRGCLQITSLVVRFDASQIVLQNGATISLDSGVQIDGRIQINSVIRIYLCIDDQGRMTILTIIVLYQGEPVPIVQPTPTPDQPPSGDDDDRDKDGERKVTICHKPQGKSGGNTITVGWDAWTNAHQKHGDTLGPCE